MQRDNNIIRSDRNFKGQPILWPLHPDPVLESEGIAINFIERFLSKVRKTETCWIWEGAVGNGDRGRILRGKRKGGNIDARRAAWILYNGEAPKGELLQSRCPAHNPLCVHPNHTRLPHHQEVHGGAFVDRRHRDLTPEQIQRFQRLCEQANVSEAEALAKMGFTVPTPEWMLKEGFSDTFASRFFAKVKKTDTCWLWIGANNEHGYGSIGKGANQRGNAIPAHIASWMFHNGPIPKGLCVCHNCPGGDNRSCVNPAHMFLGTRAENNRDALRKWKAKGCGAHWSARILTGDKAARLIHLHDTTNLKHVELAKIFGISPRYVYNVCHRRFRHSGSGDLPEPEYYI